MTDSPARRLWNARIDGASLERGFAGGPLTEDEAYDIQSEMISLSGEAVIGWKIGATNESLFDMLGVSQPILGPLFERFTHASGDALKVLPGHSIETEITIRLKSDLPYREAPYERAAIEAAIASLHPSFEIVGARFEGELAGAGSILIADGGANVATILAPEIRQWSTADLAEYPIALSLNGEAPIEGNTAVLIWDHIFDAVGWLARHPALADRGLRADDIIMTGTCTGITPLTVGDRAEADFGAMG